MLMVRMVLVLFVLLNALEGRAQIDLTVKVHNPTHVSGDDLVEAEKRAAGIFRQAKITINWELVPPAGSIRDQKQSKAWNPADLNLRFWTRTSLGFNTFGEDTLGFCLSMEKSTAIVLADEIRSRAADDFTNPGDLLGLVMAHEMGHLLLRSPTHSVDGIMQAKIPADPRVRRRMLLEFSPQQGASIRAEIHRRAGVQSARKY